MRMENKIIPLFKVRKKKKCNLSYKNKQLNNQIIETKKENNDQINKQLNKNKILNHKQLKNIIKCFNHKFNYNSKKDLSNKKIKIVKVKSKLDKKLNYKENLDNVKEENIDIDPIKFHKLKKDIEKSINFNSQNSQNSPKEIKEEMKLNPLSLLKEKKEINKNLDHKFNYKIHSNDEKKIHKFNIKHFSKIEKYDPILEIKFKKGIKSLKNKFNYNKELVIKDKIILTDQNKENKKDLEINDSKNENVIILKDLYFQKDLHFQKDQKKDQNIDKNDQKYSLKLDNTLLTAIHLNNDFERAKLIAKQLDRPFRLSEITIPLNLLKL